MTQFLTFHDLLIPLNVFLKVEKAKLVQLGNNAYDKVVVEETIHE